MSGLPATLRDLVGFLEGAGVDYMVIGGFALPFYGRMRSSLEIEVAVAIKDEDQFGMFLKKVVDAGFTFRPCLFEDAECRFWDEKTGLEFEFWMRPEGVEWDEETLRRRRRVRSNGVTFWIISPEDFIVSKLARPDRVEQDELDVKSVLTLKESELDANYLEMRAKRFGIYQLLAEIKRR